LLAFLVTELHDVFFDGDLFPGHEPTPDGCGTSESEISGGIKDARH
jgi:hypothetical protein